jgi:hypothetical protein
MFNLGKVGGDPGHYAGANAGPGTYREGDVMLRFGLELKKAYGIYLTRTDGRDITLYERCKRAKNAGCNTFISLHTNAPQAAAGVIVFYSLQRPQDKAIAEQIGQTIATAIGLKFRGAATRPLPNKPNIDYYGILRHSVVLGIEHPFIVEHGSHWEFAVDADNKINALVEAYGRILGVDKMEWTDILKLATDSPEKWKDAVACAVNAAKANGDLGALEIFKHLPELLEKIYKKGCESK